MSEDTHGELIKERLRVTITGDTHTHTQIQTVRQKNGTQRKQLHPLLLPYSIYSGTPEKKKRKNKEQEKEKKNRRTGRGRMRN